jgi:hypothetical protein
MSAARKTSEQQSMAAASKAWQQLVKHVSGKYSKSAARV